MEKHIEAFYPKILWPMALDTMASGSVALFAQLSPQLQTLAFLSNTCILVKHLHSCQRHLLALLLSKLQQPSPEPTLALLYLKLCSVAEFERAA